MLKTTTLCPLPNRPHLSVDLREADSDGEVVLGVRVLHNQVAVDAGWHLQAGEGEVVQQGRSY